MAAPIGVYEYPDETLNTDANLHIQRQTNVFHQRTQQLDQQHVEQTAASALDRFNDLTNHVDELSKVSQGLNDAANKLNEGMADADKLHQDNASKYADPLINDSLDKFNQATQQIDQQQSALPGLPDTADDGQPDYETEARKAAQEAGINPDMFVAQMQAESGLQPNNPDGTPKTSSAGATGIAQFMPDTARGLGVDPTDPLASLKGAAQLMRNHFSTLGLDPMDPSQWDQPLSYYNAGPNGNPNNPETRDYINKVHTGEAALTSPDHPTISTAASAALQSGAQPKDVAWAQSHLDDQEFINLCEKFVENSQGRSGIYASAIQAWAKQKDNRVEGLQGIKPGDAIYFDADQSNGGYGHTGVYEGNGRFISATSDGVKEYSVAQWEKITGQSVLGYVPGGDYGGGDTYDQPLLGGLRRIRDNATGDTNFEDKSSNSLFDQLGGSIKSSIEQQNPVLRPITASDPNSFEAWQERMRNAELQAGIAAPDLTGKKSLSENLQDIAAAEQHRTSITPLGLYNPSFNPANDMRPGGAGHGLEFPGVGDMFEAATGENPGEAIGDTFGGASRLAKAQDNLAGINYEPNTFAEQARVINPDTGETGTIKSVLPLSEEAKAFHATDESVPENLVKVAWDGKGTTTVPDTAIQLENKPLMGGDSQLSDVAEALRGLPQDVRAKIRSYFRDPKITDDTRAKLIANAIRDFSAQDSAIRDETGKIIQLGPKPNVNITSAHMDTMRRALGEVDADDASTGYARIFDAARRGDFEAGKDAFDKVLNREPEVPGGNFGGGKEPPVEPPAPGTPDFGEEDLGGGESTATPPEDVMDMLKESVQKAKDRKAKAKAEAAIPPDARTYLPDEKPIEDISGEQPKPRPVTPENAFGEGPAAAGQAAEGQQRFGITNKQYVEAATTKMYDGKRSVNWQQLEKNAPIPEGAIVETSNGKRYVRWNIPKKALDADGFELMKAAKDAPPDIQVGLVNHLARAAGGATGGAIGALHDDSDETHQEDLKARILKAMVFGAVGSEAGYILARHPSQIPRVAANTYINGLLSTKTLQLKSATDAMQILSGPAVRAAAALIDRDGDKIMRSKAAFAGYKGMTAGIVPAFRAMAQEVVNPSVTGLRESSLGYRDTSIASIPGRLIGALTEGTKQLAAAQAIAMRDAGDMAIGKEFSGGGFSPWEHANRMALTNNPEGVLAQSSYTLSKVIQDAPGVGKILVPFAKVPANFAGLVGDFTPGIGLLNLMRSDGKNIVLNPHASELIVKQALGTMAVLGVLAAVGKTGVMGMGPTDPVARTNWENEGYKPWSVKLPWNQDWTPVSQMPAPAQAALRYVGAMHDIQEYNHGALPIEIVKEFASSLADHRWIPSILNLLESGLSGVTKPMDANTVQRGVASEIGSGVPWYVHQPSDARLTNAPDVTPPDQGDFGQLLKNTLQSKIPGASQLLPSRVNSAGQPIRNANEGVNAFVAYGGHPVQNSNVLHAFGTAGKPVPLPPRFVSIGGNSKTQIQLTPQEQSQYKQIQGQMLERALAPYVTSGRWDRMSQFNREEILKNLDATSRANADRRIIASAIQNKAPGQRLADRIKATKGNQQAAVAQHQVAL